MKIAFLFSGQGAQYPGMMRELCDKEEVAREVFLCADSALGRCISKLCFEGTQEELNLTHNTQPCVLAADLAAALTLKSYGVMPEAVAGFSLGEYAALAFAEAVSMPDVFSMVQFRADAMQQAVGPGEGAMAAIVGVSVDQVEALCRLVSKGYVAPANFNSPIQTVISGTIDGVDEAISLAEAEGILCVRLAVSAPFHCLLMEPAARQLQSLFSEKTFKAPTLPVYMNVDGCAVREVDAIADRLVRQAMSPVRWTRTLENMCDDGFDTFIECGPGRTLSGLVKKTLKNVTICRVEDVKTLESTLGKLGK